MRTINFIFSSKLDIDFFKLLIKEASKSYLIIKVLPCDLISLFISSINSASTSKELPTIWATSFVGKVKFNSLYIL